MCVRVCDIEFVVFTDCESCTRPISTNPESMEAREDGLTRGTCFLARSLEAVAFAGLLRLSWCVVGGVDVFVFFSRLFFFFKHTRPTASTRPPLASFTSLLVMRPFSAYRQKKPHNRGAYRVPLFISLCVCVTFVVFTDCERCTWPISTNPESMEAGEYGLTRGTCFVARRLEVVAVAGLLWISRCVLDAAGFRVFFPFFFSSNAHGLLQV